VRWVGSLVVHAVLGAVLFAVARHPSAPAGEPHAVIEVIEAPAGLKTIDVIAEPRSSGGPGAASGRRDASSVSPSAIAPPRTIAPRTGSPRTIVATRDATRPRSALDATSDAFEDPRGAISFDAGASQTGACAGASLPCADGAGRGKGTGNGIGFGDGGTVAPGLPPPAPPPAPKLSKARPARLVFPSRQREVDDGELYVMRVTVDADGFVSGATLVRGFGGGRDDIASAQIWRFRYDPARDDDGQPVRSVLEQRFLVQ